MFRSLAFRNIVGGCILLLTLSQSPSLAAPFLLQHQFTMPAGIDPDRKIFFAFSGDSAIYTGSDLIDGNPGVEFHSAVSSGFRGNRVVLSLESPVPDCIDPLTAEVRSIIDTAEFPTVTVPWQNVPPSPFPITLSDQPGAVQIGEPINSATAGFGLAYGILELTTATRAELFRLDPACLDEFRALQFRATAFGTVAVPEPGNVALTIAAALTGGMVLRRKRQKSAL